METLALQLWNEIRTIGIGDVLDVIIIAYAIYRILSVVRKTSTGSVMKGIVVLFAVLVLSSVLELSVTTYLLRQMVQMGVVILVILFQPELRRLLERAGSSKIGIFGKAKTSVGKMELVIEIVVNACAEMAKAHTGALIVFERDLGLSDYAASGTPINATITGELVRSIFYPNSPLHDGAVIIREDRIIAARCMLPMSSNPAISSELGMRHKAGIGISERTDAVVVIVSEEMGTIAVAVDGMLKRKLDKETFRSLLAKELIGEEKTRSGPAPWLKSRKDGK